MKFLSLFSGIGGIDLGLERAGMECVGQVEIDPFCRAVLKKHWPSVMCMEDVKSVKGDEFGPIDIIAGGFPCQDISCAGKGKGIFAERSGLWWEMRRVIEAVRPAWVLAENVPALRTRGADEVFASLEGLGYTVEPLVVGAWACGLRHKRDRCWIVAHRYQVGWNRERPRVRREHEIRPGLCWQTKEGFKGWKAMERWLGQAQQDAYASSAPSESCGEDYGVSRQLDRTAALGNSVVPQVVEMIGRAIMEIHSS